MYGHVMYPLKTLLTKVTSTGKETELYITHVGVALVMILCLYHQHVLFLSLKMYSLL
jgi:hypothetical protein